MDFYTKLFLANMVAMVFTAWWDGNILNGELARIRFVGEALGLWATASIISVPVWSFYIIITY